MDSKPILLEMQTQNNGNSISSYRMNDLEDLAHVSHDFRILIFSLFQLFHRTARSGFDELYNMNNLN